MKSVIKQQDNTTFKPIEFTITMESEDEARLIWNLLNLSLMSLQHAQSSGLIKVNTVLPYDVWDLLDRELKARNIRTKTCDQI